MPLKHAQKFVHDAFYSGQRDILFSPGMSFTNTFLKNNFEIYVFQTLM